ncbi:helix-turn-helix domain-containing protein [Salmonella enterica]|nr:helix-turn-helix domain-containing protein [Salmonella enterica]
MVIKYSACGLVYVRKKIEVIFSKDKIMFSPGDLILTQQYFADLFSDTQSAEVVYFPIELLHDYTKILISKNTLKTNGIYRKNFISTSIHDINTELVNNVFRVIDYTDNKNIKNSAIFLLLTYFCTSKDFLSFLFTFFSIKYQASLVIRSDIKRKWTLTEIASSVYLSVSSLKLHLKKENTSYIKILTECRMEHAARQLLLGEKNINSVAIDCGYNQTSYFIGIFNAYFGVTPGAYLKNLKNIN